MKLGSTSLRSVQAFCAVARLGSVAAAGAELGVTPSACSHLIRDLEARLSTILFERAGGRTLKLTEDGRMLADQVGPAMRRIEDGLSTFGKRRVELRISTTSTFAMRWLVPRLVSFQTRHPDIELLVSTTTRPVDFAREAFDCAIRWGAGGWSEVDAEQLYEEELAPVCSPAMVQSGRLGKPADLRDVRLLHTRNVRDHWARWLKAAGLSGVNVEAGPTFETRSLGITAAIGQMGVAVIDPRLVEIEVAAGQLVHPFPPRLKLPTGYWLVWRRGRAVSRPLAAFRTWLKEQVEGRQPIFSASDAELRSAAID
jgi:DNA-binding transcriptional LysR family regulator